MKLFSEQLTILKFVTLLIFCILEILLFIILFILYKPIFLKIFEKMEEVSLEKTKLIAKSIDDIIELIFLKYTQDLKFIAKHMSFLVNDTINIESEYYQNIINNEDKHIYDANSEELKKYFPKYYNDSQEKFLFLENYFSNYIDNKANRINILNYLMNNTKHPELNSISFYKLEGNVSDIEKGSIKEISAKYLISILKTVFINKLITKGRDFDINHFLLFIEDELYIYPPDSYNNTYISKLESLYTDYGDPGFILYMMNMQMFAWTFDFDYFYEDYIFPIFPYPILEEDKYYDIECLSIPFEEPLVFGEYSFAPKICMEFNMTKVFSKGFFESKEAFHFLFFTEIANDIIILFNDRYEIFSEIRKVFNDPIYQKYYYKFENENEYNYFYFFQFLYLDLFKDLNIMKNHNITLDDIFQEYEIIKNRILDDLEYNEEYSEDEYFSLNIKKTICKRDIYYNYTKCFKDNFLIVVYPFYNDYNVMDENYIENPNKKVHHDLFYSMTILDNNYDYFKWKINKIILIIMIKLLLFFLVSSMSLYYLYFIFIQIFLERKYKPINQIFNLIKGSFFEINDKNKILNKNKEILIKPDNKEIFYIKNLFDYLIKIMLFKNNLKENECDSNNNLSLNKIESFSQYKDIILDIDNKETTIMLYFIISYMHFRKGLFKSSEHIFNKLIKEINLYQNSITNKNEISDSNMKDKLSRYSKVSYLNEYSLTNELSKNILKIIKVKLLVQKIYYLYGLNIFNQEKMKANSIKKYNKTHSKKRYEEAIKYFIESKNISKLLGTNIIRQIFSLIMISKCYLEIKNYNEAMININEALLLFSDLQKSFKDRYYFNPKIMMFTENYIFQSIMISMAQATFNFNKYPQSCWILMKMIETSPFVFNNIHFQACFLLYNSLTRIENLYSIPFRQMDKYKKRINKMLLRISIRLFNYDKNINSDSLNIRNNINFISFSTEAITYVNSINISSNNMYNRSNFKNLSKNKDNFSNKLSLSIKSSSHLSKSRHKNISLCISEKLINEINGDELKDVLIKYLKKCFSNEENKFCFIQFSYNGKKTVTIKSDTLEIFLQKLEANKIAFKIKDAFNKNNNEIKFMEFSNLFLNIIKSNKRINYESKNDDIIILFINTEDIRFNGQKECVDTINELNNNNYSVIIFTYDNEIEEKKMEGIYSLIHGLNDGHFFQIKNYQQIKQVFMNFCVKDSQEKFNDYNYEITDFML